MIYNKYLPTPCGQVISFARKIPAILRPRKHTSGYYQVTLWESGKQRDHYIHRLVYEFWKGTIPTGLEINHIDGNKLNNNIENLEALTHQENMHHATKNRLMRRKLSNKQVAEIRKSHKTQQEIAKIYNISQGYVSQLKLGTANRTKRY